MTVKDQVRLVIDKLDDHATWDDVFDELETVAALDESIQQSQAGNHIPHSEIKKLLDPCPVVTK
jgi:hypothetical protein